MGGVESAGSPIMLNIRRLKGETKTCIIIFKIVLIIHIATITYQCHHPYHYVYLDDFVTSGQCTYCGGDVENTFSTSGILAACFLFPIGHYFNLKSNGCILFSLFVWEQSLPSQSFLNSDQLTPRNPDMLLSEADEVCQLYSRVHLTNLLN